MRTPADPSRRPATAATTTAALLTLTLMLPTAALASSQLDHAKPTPGASTKTATPRVVATGLDNPRHLTVAGSTVYVAESGSGGAGPCFPGPEGEACFGASGAITAISHGRQQRILIGLPSLAAPTGASASGPVDIEVSGKRLAILIGLGGTTTTRAAYGPAAATLGTLQVGRLGGTTTRTLADLAAYEATDPNRDTVDSNPAGLTRTAAGFAVADAGGNDVVAVARDGAMSTPATFAARSALAPPFLGLPPGAMMPMQSVPTGVTRGPDGALYVSELTGFPFPVGGARIWRLPPAGAPQVFATGLTNVTDLAWAGDRLYAVQLAAGGLLSAGGAPPVGSLVQVTPGGATHRVVAANLTAPYGVAVQGRTAYVTTCAVCAGAGQVVAIDLP